jgi:hypothetical protein
LWQFSRSNACWKHTNSLFPNFCRMNKSSQPVSQAATLTGVSFGEGQDGDRCA